MTQYRSAGHTQKMPEIWPALVDHNNELLTQHPDSHTWESGLQLHDAIAQLTNETFERVRYFALGEVACAIQTHIGQPEVRGEVVEAAAKGILGYRGVYYETRDVPRDDFLRGMLRYELSADAMSGSTAAIIRPEAGALLPGVEQLADALQLAHSDRQIKRQLGGGIIGQEGIAHKLEYVTGSGRAVKSLNINTFSAASGLFKLLIRSALPEDRKDEDCLITEVLDVPNLDMSSATVAAVNIASRLHADEFRAFGQRRYVTSPEPSTIKVDRKLIPKFPERISEAKPDTSQSTNGQYDLWTNRALHDDRIGCPALYVRQLIPHIMGMLPDIIMKVDGSIIKANAWRSAAYAPVLARELMPSQKALVMCPPTTLSLQYDRTTYDKNDKTLHDNVHVLP